MTTLKDPRNLIGKKFEGLLVLNYVGKVKKQNIYQCRCICGKEKNYHAKNLEQGRSRSCGCLKNKLSRVRERIGVSIEKRCSNSVFNSYKKWAKVKKVPFCLSEVQIQEIIFNNCHYCNVVPSNLFSATYSDNSVREINYSGIDEKIRGIGYTKENSLPCCWVCNKMKGALQYDQFLEQIRLIYLQRSKINDET